MQRIVTIIGRYIYLNFVLFSLFSGVMVRCMCSHLIVVPPGVLPSDAIVSSPLLRDDVPGE